jgi:acetolactate synthase-1/2/3 large subunit
MESPRGINDPGLGAFAEVLKEADFVVLLGKQPDFTLRFAATPAVAADCRFALIDPEPEGLARGMRTLGDPRRIAFAVLCDAAHAAAALTEAAGGGLAAGAWAREVEAALRFRPDAWRALAGRREGVAHPAAVGAAVQALIDSHRDAVLVSDGGEFGQWAQACVDAPERIINGPGGSIGSALPFALAARLARPDTLVVAMSGDGAFGYHVAEFETAAREALTCVAVVGNDACWNAEHQIQLRTYGADRARGCELLPARYDEAARAFGGHGEFVPAGGDLQGALTRAAAANRAACVNVLIERVAAPAVTRPAVRAAAAAR